MRQAAEAAQGCGPAKPTDLGQRFAFHLYRFQVLGRQRDHALRVEKDVQLEDELREGYAATLRHVVCTFCQSELIASRRSL